MNRIQKARTALPGRNLRAVYQQGLDAFALGVPDFANPYDSGMLHRAWDEGYSDALEVERQERFSADDEPEDDPRLDVDSEPGW